MRGAHLTVPVEEERERGKEVKGKGELLLLLLPGNQRNKLAKYFS